VAKRHLAFLDIFPALALLRAGLLSVAPAARQDVETSLPRLSRRIILAFTANVKSIKDASEPLVRDVLELCNMNAFHPFVEKELLQFFHCRRE
jgi:hypothetical protein